MELGFAVPNVGPLAQISLQLFSPETAVYLATGAYGWWKARERSKSLVEVLSASKAQLSSTSTFNWQTYQRTREIGKLQGLAVQSGQLQAAMLPKGSTALPPNAALACLRALITGLLCLHGVEACTAILAEVVPRGLIQYDQVDADLVFEGPQLSSLKLLVAAVAAEEDNNTLRQYLMEQVTTQQTHLQISSMDDIFQTEETHRNEIPLIMGLLEWIITPTHKRESPVYPTRSLVVWTMANILSKLGFEVSASTSVARSSRDYERLVTAPRSSPYYADIVLVLEPGVDTDSLMRAGNVTSVSESLRPQISQVRAVPWLVFRRYRGRDTEINTQYLADIWTYCFIEARNATRGIEHLPNGFCKINIMSPAVDELSGPSATDFHRHLVAEWAPPLLKICGRYIGKFVPPAENPRAGWSLYGIRHVYEAIHVGSTKAKIDEQVAGNCRVVIAVMLGTLYGVTSKCVIEDGKYMDLDSNLATEPDLIYGSKTMFRLATLVGQGIDGIISPFLWVDFVLQLLLGKPVDTGDMYNLKPLVLGAHLNGITAVSDALVHPSPSQNCLIRMHLQRGQILNLPTTEEGLISSAEREVPLMTLTLNPEPKLAILQRDQSLADPEGFRIDAEPCWESDPRRVIFRVRQHGRIAASIRFHEVFHRLSDSWVPCSCGTYTNSVQVPVVHRWQQVGLNQILQYLIGQATIDDWDKVLVDASASEEALFVALGCLRARKMKISLGCLQCTYRSIQNPEENESVAIVVAKWGPS